MTIYQFETEDLVQIGNDLKDLVVDQLVTDNVLTREAAEAWAKSHMVIVYKPSWIRRLVRKNDNLCWKVVKFTGTL
jgi:hypothetical protein